MNKGDTSPTMIIPAGTEIQIDVHGQLSVRTPGNLVIQNSGHYGEIESVGGSIRIEANAEVEAVSVRCAETCYVQGSLTSWRVKAQSLQLEERAQARIVLQDTDTLEIGKNAQLVGNFSSEKELFLLFSRFAQQLRSMPFYFDRKEPPPQLELPTPEEKEEPSAEGAATASVPGNREGAAGSSELSSRVFEAAKELPDHLFFALVLLERESKNEAYGTTSVHVLEELVKLLKSRDLETLQHTYRTLFGRVVEPGDDVRRARELIEKYFREAPAEAAKP
ncbi:MAG: hypothetical protein GY856_40575 [bacterium]|nr:hypothetical protein [bacterium]